MFCGSPGDTWLEEGRHEATLDLWAAGGTLSLPRPSQLWEGTALFQWEWASLAGMVKRVEVVPPPCTSGKRAII